MLTPAVASAQQAASPERWFVHISGARQSGSEDVTDTFPLTLYDEVSQSEADYRFDRLGGVFEIGGGFPLFWRRISVGVSYTHMGSSAPALVRAAVPHPVVLDRPRLAEITANDLERSENAVHFRAIWTYPIRPKIDVALFVGPSIINVSQDLISTVQPGAEVPPFNTVDLTGVEVAKGSATTLGVNVGIEATYHLRGNSRLTRGLGFQAFFKYAGGSTDIELNDDTVETKVGGPQVGLGVRFEF
jgi:hypothetical protein